MRIAGLVRQRGRSTFGPHAIGAERFATVSSGSSLAQVACAILGNQARVENLDRDEVHWSTLCRHDTGYTRSRRARTVTSDGLNL
jgi:hypothetical protein